MRILLQFSGNIRNFAIYVAEIEEIVLNQRVRAIDGLHNMDK